MYVITVFANFPDQRVPPKSRRLYLFDSLPLSLSLQGWYVLLHNPAHRIVVAHFRDSAVPNIVEISRIVVFHAGASRKILRVEIERSDATCRKNFSRDEFPKNRRPVDAESRVPPAICSSFPLIRSANAIAIHDIKYSMYARVVRGRLPRQRRINFSNKSQTTINKPRERYIWIARFSRKRLSIKRCTAGGIKRRRLIITTASRRSYPREIRAI